MSDLPIIKVALFPRPGGKRNLAKRIVSLFPDGYENMTYVEPFVGGGSIFFRKLPSVVDVINDLDETVFSIYNEVKTRNINNEFRRALKKEEFSELIGDTNPVRTLERVIYSIFGQGKSYQKLRYPNETYKKDFNRYHLRLQPVSIFNKDYRELVRDFDSENTFFYFDPPYSVEQIKKNPYDHYTTPQELFDCVINIRGKFLMSYNDTPENRELFSCFNITDIDTVYHNLGVRGGKCKSKNELLISNYGS